MVQIIFSKIIINIDFVFSFQIKWSIKKQFIKISEHNFPNRNETVIKR